MIDFSIVSGTLNREISLIRMVSSVRDTMPKNLTYEIILVDGGSSDGTIRWAKSQSDVRLIEQGRRLGAVIAYNAGFNQAIGKYVVALNDDAIVHGQVFQQAHDQLERDLTTGQIAIPYTNPGSQIPFVQHVEFRSGKYLYANFSVTRRELADRLGWWSSLYHHYAGDAHLSMEIWKASYRVERLQGDGYIEHLETQDETRQANMDSQNFFFRWNIWDGGVINVSV